MIKKIIDLTKKCIIGMTKIVFFIITIYYKPKEVTVRKLTKYIKKFGWKYHIIDKKTNGDLIKVISCKIKAKNTSHFLVNIELQKEYINFSIPEYMKITTYSQPAVAKALISDFSFKGKFKLDTNTDMLSLHIFFPITLSGITFNQFRACLLELLKFADDNFYKIRKLTLASLKHEK